MPDPTRSSPFALEVSAASVEAIAEAVLVLMDQDLHELATARLDGRVAVPAERAAAAAVGGCTARSAVDSFRERASQRRAGR